MFHPTPKEKALITAAALAIGARPDDLNALISFESKYDPQAKNPLSSARGLLQFTDAAARDLNYKDSLDLVTKNKTFAAQIKNAVIPYLSRYKPFSDAKSLYLSVFYPAARTWPDTAVFPDRVRMVNPGIYTVADYVKLVDSRKGLPLIIPFSLFLVSVLVYLITRREQDDKRKTA